MTSCQHDLLSNRPVEAAPYGYLLGKLLPDVSARKGSMSEDDAENRLKISCLLASNSKAKGAHKLRKVVLGAPVGQCSGCLTILPYP